MVGIQSATADIRRGKKIERRRKKKKPQNKNIMSASAMQGGHKKAYMTDKQIGKNLICRAGKLTC